METSNPALGSVGQADDYSWLPDKPVAPVPMRAVVSAVSTTNPDAEAKTQQLAQQAGMPVDLTRSNPEAARQRAVSADLDRRELEIRNPILASQLRDPEFAGVAHDDLDSLSRIENGAASMRTRQNPGFLGSSWAEAQSLAGNFNAAFLGAFKPFVDAAGALAQGALETPKALLDAVVGGVDPDFDELKDIWVRPRTFAVQKYVTQPTMDYMTQGVIPGPPQYATDPATGGVTKNPDYRWYGRPLANTMEEIPGALAAFGLTGKIGGAAAEGAGADEAGAAAVEQKTVPAILGTSQAQSTYTAARLKGADQKTAVMAALAAGVSTYGLMGEMPGPVPTSTVKGAIGQWAARSAGLGTALGVADNTVARGYDPDRGMFDSLPQSIATMAAYEGVGALGHIADAVEQSKLRQRSPEKFQSFVDAATEGQESVRVPAQDFVNYFQGKNLDPAAVANHLGVTNLAEAATAGSDLEIPKESWIGRLEPEHQKALLPDVVDPSTDLTQRQAEGGKAQLQEWIANGGVQKLQEEYAQADAETQATTEWKQVHGDLKQRYVNAGESETTADSYATLQANAISNLARKAGLNPGELLALHNPDIKVGEAPAALYQSGVPIGGVRSLSELTGDMDEAERRYDSLGQPNYISGDRVKELLQGWNDKGNRPALEEKEHADASKIAYELFYRKAARLPEGSDVQLVTGPVAAGKTTTIQGEHNLTYEVNLSNREKAFEHLDRLLEMGLKPTVDYVHTSPELSVERRASRAQADGRTVRIDRSTTQHIELPGTIQAIADHYGDQVAINTYDTSVHPARAVPAAEIGKLAYTGTREDLLEQQQRHLDTLRDSGGISAELHQQISRRAPDARGGAGAEGAGAPERGWDGEGSGEGDEAEPGAARVGSAGGDGADAAGREPERAAGGNEPADGGAAERADAVHAVAGDKRGWFRMRPDGSYEIGKTKVGDFSTFVHEPAHAYLEMFRELTQREAASDTLKDDFRKITAWLGTTPEEAYRDGFTREQHEKWATANEQYLRDGNAPSSALRRVFDHFSVWLRSVYGRAERLGVELSPEIRGVMKRLYQSEDAVNRASLESGRPLFEGENADAAGWSEQEQQNYADGKGLELEKARIQLQRELAEAALRERTEKWREEKGNVREAVTQEVDKQPEYKAIRSLRRGSLEDGTPMTLNKDELIRQFGEDRVKQLQRLHPMLYRAEGGTDAETAAELFGYGSGEEMMRALESAPRRAIAIERGTRDYMTAKHGDIRYDGTIDDKARLAVENDERAKNLHSELAALHRKIADLQESASAKAAGVKASKDALKRSEFPSLDAYKTAAKVFMEAKAPADINPTRYLHASRKFAGMAFDAVRRGATHDAFDAKSKELLNHYMFREATFAKEYLGKFTNEVARTLRPAAQQKLGLADAAVAKAGEIGDYRDQHNWLLSRYALTAPTGAPERTLRAWAEDMHAQLKEPAIADSILSEKRIADWRSVPLSEIRDLHDALRNVRKLAGAELQASINGKRVEFEAAAQELAAEMRANLAATPEKFFEQPKTALDKARDMARSVDVSASRMEFLIDKAGGGLRGAWRKYVWEPYQNAKGDEYAMQADWTKRLNDQVEAEAERQGLRLSEKVKVEGIPDSEMLTRKELVSVAMNMGNESNRDRLEKTFADRGFDPKAIDKIGGMLTAEEWRFAQAVGDSLKPWGERMNEFEKQQNGLAPKMVEVEPFKVMSSDGVEMNLDGWYFPVKYDPRYVLKGQEEESSKIAKALVETGYGRATTSRGYTKARTGYAGPLLLDYERVLTDHIAKVTKDLSHREFAQNTYRLLTHPDVRQAMRECWGPKYDQEAVNWLRATVNDRNGSVDGGADDMRYMEKLRSNLVKASLAYKASTAVLQFTHLSRLSLFTRPGSFTSAMVDFWKNPIQATEAIREMSPNVMRFRGEHLDRDYNATLRDLAGKKDPIATALRIGYAPMKYIDHAISFPLWRSVYNETLLKNGAEMDEAESHTAAVQAADSAVRMGLGDASAGDLPPLMRSQDMLKKMESTLYGFENVNYNIMRHKVAGDAQRSWRAGSYAGAAGKLTFGAAMAFFVPAIMSALVRGDGPKDGENLGLWAAKRSLFFAGGTIPWVKDGVAFMEHGSLNPMVSWAERTLGEAKQRASEGETDWPGLGIDALQAIGDTLGMPGTDQAAHTARYVHRANQGKIENPNLWGAIVGGH